MKVVIIGNGIAGITTARHIRKQSDHEILVISAESEHFFSRTALMYIYMGHMKYEHTKPYEDWFWSKNRIDLKNAYITDIDFDKKTLKTAEGEEIAYDKLVICTGSVPKTFGWPGEKLNGVQGLYSKQDVELMEVNTQNVKHAVVVGGGLIGIEMAEMLQSRGIQTTFLIREKKYWNSVLPNEEAELVSRHIAEHHINLIPNAELAEIIGNEQGFVKAIKTTDGNTIECQFVALTIGVTPNIKFLESSALETETGVLVNEFLETNIPDVYALGDCAQFKNPRENHPPVEKLWYTAKMQGKALAKTICGNRTKYERGIWFNSAKFLDIEYQTYGLMFNNPLAGEDTFYWEHPKGKISVRANFNKADGSIKGFNFFGMRFKQTVADMWIREHKSIAHCISHLNEGIFDAEFSTNHHKKILESFEKAYPLHKTEIHKKKKFLFF